MASIRTNIIKQDEISECLDFLYKEDNHLDERAYIQNKIMTPSVDGWPIHIIQNIMKRIFNKEYEIECVDFRTQKGGATKLHADSGSSESQLKGKGVIVPLVYGEDNYTIFFNNYWNGHRSKFSKNFTEEKYKGLTETEKRNFKLYGNQPISEYNDIANISQEPFDKLKYEQWLTHIPYEDLNGFEIAEIHPWKIGSAIVWNRSQIHCSSHHTAEKVFLSIFCNRK